MCAVKTGLLVSKTDTESMMLRKGGRERREREALERACHRPHWRHPECPQETLPWLQQPVTTLPQAGGGSY